jgi:hypothetical protein
LKKASSARTRVCFGAKIHAQKIVRTLRANKLKFRAHSVGVDAAENSFKNAYKEQQTHNQEKLARKLC